MKFWIQSFLLGVPKIIVGFRDQYGTLLRVEELITHRIPKIVEGRGRTWDGNVCINFAAEFMACMFPARDFCALIADVHSLESDYKGRWRLED